MLSKRIMYGFCLIMFLTAGCGVFEPEPSTGTLNIIMKNSQANGQLNKQLGTQLSNVHCIIKRNYKVEYAAPLKKRGYCFQTSITKLKSGRHYSVFLYGKESRSYYIVVSAHQAGIEVEAGKETTIELDWSPFITTLNIPISEDTVSGRFINLEWDSVIGTKGYRLFVDDDIDFHSPITANEIKEHRTSIYSGLLQEGTYYWKVQCVGSWAVSSDALNARTKDRGGHWSEVSSFVFKKQPQN